MALNCGRPPDGTNSYMMKNSNNTKDSRLTMLPPLPGPCLISSLHEFRAGGNGRHPFYGMLDNTESTIDHEDGIDMDHNFHHVEKKRRLTNDQVKSLEVNFEIESKLEPERKNQLAQELGLQPRQVAVWFQNRRARYKTKQLERDYDILKVQYDAVRSERDKLEAEVTRLRDLLHAQATGKGGGPAGTSSFKFKAKEDPEHDHISQDEDQTPAEEDHQPENPAPMTRTHINRSPSVQMSDDALSKQMKQQDGSRSDQGEASSDSDQTELVDAAPKSDMYVQGEQYYQHAAAKLTLAERLCSPQLLHQIAVKMEEGFLQREDLYNDYFIHSLDQDQHGGSDSMLCFNWHHDA